MYRTILILKKALLDKKTIIQTFIECKNENNNNSRIKQKLQATLIHKDPPRVSYGIPYSNYTELILIEIRFRWNNYEYIDDILWNYNNRDIAEIRSLALQSLQDFILNTQNPSIVEYEPEQIECILFFINKLVFCDNYIYDINREIELHEFLKPLNLLKTGILGSGISYYFYK